MVERGEDPRKVNFMKAKALREKREYLNIREMVEDIGSRYAGMPAYMVIIDWKRL